MSEAKIRTIPTTMVTGYWDAGSVSEIPEEVKIVMSDGKKAVYRLMVEQPKPKTMTPAEMARIFTENVYGGYKVKK